MTLHRSPEPTLAETEESLTEGDESYPAHRPGTAREALAVHRRSGACGSARSRRTSARGCRRSCSASYAYELTGSSTFVGLLTFAQLGPLLLLSLVGGLIADALDRRRLLIALQLEQAVFSLVLAAVVGWSSNPSQRGPVPVPSSLSASATP